MLCWKKKNWIDLYLTLHSRQRDGLLKAGFVVFSLIYICMEVAMFDLSKGAKYGNKKEQKNG